MDSTAKIECIRYINKKRIYAVGKSGAIIKTNDGGNSWKTDSSGTDQNINKILFVDNKAIAVGDNGTILMNQNISTTTKIENESQLQNVIISPTPFNNNSNLKISQNLK